MTMTKEKILEAVIQCESIINENMEYFNFSSLQSSPKRVDPEIDIEVNGPGFLRHLLFMCGEIRVMLEEDRREKVMRWLGFLQGALWSSGIPLDTFKNQNRPDISI